MFSKAKTIILIRGKCADKYLLKSILKKKKVSVIQKIFEEYILKKSCVEKVKKAFILIFSIRSYTEKHRSEKGILNTEVLKYVLA